MINALSIGFMFERLSDPERVSDEAFGAALELVVNAYLAATAAGARPSGSAGS